MADRTAFAKEPETAAERRDSRVARPEVSWRGSAREFLEIIVIIEVVTGSAWFVPVDYHVLGDAPGCGACDTLSGHRLVAATLGGFLLSVTDATVMEPRLANLLLNAGQHAPMGIRITIADHANETDEHLVAITDDGPCIGPKLQANPSQTFRRGPTVRGDCVGAGLSIARGLTQARSGEVFAGKKQGGARSVLRPLFKARKRNSRE